MLLSSSIDPNWCVVEKQFDIANNRHYESIFALGTGFMTTRASIEEGFEEDDQAVEFTRVMNNTTLEKTRSAKSHWGTYIPVIQGDHPTLRMGMLNLPYYLGLVLKVDGEKLDLEKSSIQKYRRWLNLLSATLYRSVVWKTQKGKLVEITWRRYMNPEDRFVCVQDVVVRLSEAAEVVVESFVDNNVRTNGFDNFISAKVAAQGEMIFSDVTTNDQNRIVTASQCFFNRAAVQQAVLTERRATSRAIFELGNDDALEIRKISVTACDLYFEPDHLVEAAQKILTQNSSLSPDDLYGRHCMVWVKLWQLSDIKIQADDAPGYNSQLAIREALFHLLRSKGLEDRGLVCPKGNTSEMYYGSIFWDTEIFIQPFYIYTHPKIARTVPAFRYRGLESARKLAQSYGYRGARYPWQADKYGNETCVPWQYADHQVHITADVALGVWHYICATGDKEFLYNQGAEIIFETARYWTERVDQISGREGYQVLGVMGPDEYKPFSNNNAYTNFLVRKNFEIAVEVAREMKQDAPNLYQLLVKKIGLTEAEIHEFAKIARGITVPQDVERNIIWQCDQFDTAYAEIDIDSIWKDSSLLFGQYVSQEKRYRSKVIKQSDVMALMGLFPDSFSYEQKLASYQYYEPFSIHDSSNSVCHIQIVASSLGWATLAYDSWLKSIDIDFGKLPKAADGVHMGNMGGMWQEVVFGFGGFANALNCDELEFKPCLPEQIHAITFPLVWKQQSLRVTVTDRTITVENLSRSGLRFHVGKKDFQVAGGQTVAVDYR